MRRAQTESVHNASVGWSKSSGLSLLFLALAPLLLSSAGFAADETTVILVRHAEKELTGGDVPLRSPDGVARARDLVDAVRSAGVSVAISSTYKRTRQTLDPAVAALGIPSERVLEITEPDRVALEILTKQRGRTILVAGHSNTVPQIIEALGAPSLCPPFEIDDEHGCMIPDPEYDHLFVVTVPEVGPATVVRALYGSPSPSPSP
jgi:broad specificity phosphatase PhoE